MLFGFDSEKVEWLVDKLRPAMLELGEKTAKNTVISVEEGKCFPLLRPEEKTPFIRVHVTKHEGRQASPQKIFDTICEALKEDTELLIIDDFREKN